MNLIRVNPFRELQGFHTGVDRLFNDAVSRFFGDGTRVSWSGTWLPRVDIRETESELVFAAELPGFGREDIKVTVEDGQLTIEGERKVEKQEDAKYHLTERSYKNFYRSFLIPTSVDEGKVAANLKDGVLTLTLPKKEEAKPKQIPVKIQ